MPLPRVPDALRASDNNNNTARNGPRIAPFDFLCAFLHAADSV